LHRREPEVRQDAVGRRQAFERRGEVSDVRVREPSAISEGRQPTRSELESVRVAVQAEEADVGPRGEKSPRVPAGSDGRVDVEPAALGLEKVDDLLDQDRFVRRLLNVVRPTSLFSCPVSRVPCPVS
jgi:hypothetical protein